MPWCGPVSASICRSLPGVKVGKHSTGGVGDKMSLIVVPIVAACGALVPKSSGRALGHSGGTIDKLEAIPGFRIDMSMAECLAVLGELGCVFVGQTADLAPADKKLYALRDVTGTIESVPLIASSIMSKKIAEGADALILDVKVGRGAFMKTTDDARRLAGAMVEIGRRVGLPTRAVLTAMDAPLGRAVGNALEVIESIETLKGRGPADVTELSTTLASQMLVVAGVAADETSARARVSERRHQRRGARQVPRGHRAAGRRRVGRGRLRRLASTAAREDVTAARSGFITGIDAECIGRASMLLGAGRERLDTPIDYGAGILMRASVGEEVVAGQAVAELCIRPSRPPRGGARPGSFGVYVRRRGPAVGPAGARRRGVSVSTRPNPTQI